MTIIVAAVSQLIVQLVANMTVVALPDISVDLNFTSQTIMWVNIIYLMSFVAFSIPFAKIISQFGIKKCTKVSLLGLFLSILITVFAVDGNMLLFSRFIQGMTSAALAISIYVMVVEEFPENEMGSALGAVASAGYVGMLMAPSFMGFMCIFNWRYAFLILIPILAVLLFMLSRIKSEWYTDKKPIDNIGSLLYVLLMVFFTYGLTILDDYGIIPVIVSIVILVIFVKVEKKVEDPIFNLRLIRNNKYVIGNYAAMVTYFTTTIAITILSFHLQYILDFTEYIVGLILIIAPIIMIGMSGIGGQLTNRFDPRFISGVAMGCLVCSMTIYFLIDLLPIEWILIGCALQGVGNGLFSAPNNKYVLTLVDKEHLPDASSVLSTSKEFGKILSSGIYTLIFSVYIGDLSLEHVMPNACWFSHPTL